MMVIVWVSLGDHYRDDWAAASYHERKVYRAEGTAPTLPSTRVAGGATDNVCTTHRVDSRFANLGNRPSFTNLICR
jgi:hypothetical protein